MMQLEADMKLDAEQARSFRTWLTSRGGVLLDCPICHRRDWMAPEMVSLERAHGQADDAPAGAYSEIVVTCALCGFNYHFSLDVIKKTRRS